MRSTSTRIERQPNTRDAHRLIAWAQARGDAGPLVERLFRAYFLEGRFVGDRDALAELAGRRGAATPRAARAWLDPGTEPPNRGHAEERVRATRHQGVPFFIFDGSVGLSGAHPPEAMREAIAQARTKA